MKNLLRFIAILTLLFGFNQFVKAAPILIISSMRMEYLPITHYLKQDTMGEFHGIPYTEGQIEKKMVIATYTGLGSINSGIVTAILINRFHPSSVIFSGVGGSLQLNINYGDIVVSTKIFSVNFGQYTKNGPSFDGLWPNPIRKIKPPLIYPSSPYLISTLKNIQKSLPYKIYFGVIASDQHFPFDKGVDRLLTGNNVDALAMEDIGVAHACWLYRTPMISIRGISDNIDKKTPYTRKRAAIVAKHAAFVTYSLIKKLSVLHKS